MPNASSCLCRPSRLTRQPPPSRAQPQPRPRPREEEIQWKRHAVYKRSIPRETHYMASPEHRLQQSPSHPALPHSRSTAPTTAPSSPTIPLIAPTGPKEASQKSSTVRLPLPPTLSPLASVGRGGSIAPSTAEHQLDQRRCDRSELTTIGQRGGVPAANHARPAGPPPTPTSPLHHHRVSVGGGCRIRSRDTSR